MGNQCLISCSNMILTFRIFCTLLFALCVQAQFNFPGKIHRPKGAPQKIHPQKVPVNNKKGKYLLVEVPDEYLKKILGYGSSEAGIIDGSEESSEEKTDIHIVPGSLVPMRPPNQKPYPNPYPHPRQFPPLLLRRIIMQWLRRQKIKLRKPIVRRGRKPMIAWKPMVVYGGPNYLHRPWRPTKPNLWGQTHPVAWGPPQPTNIETSEFDAPNNSDYWDDYEEEDKRQKGQKTKLDEVLRPLRELLSFEEAEEDLEDQGTEIEEAEMSNEDEKDTSQETKLVHKSSFSFGPPGLRSIVQL